MKTSELAGVALDWAVAKCEAVEVDYKYYRDRIMFDTYQDDPPPVNEYNDNRMQVYSPSTDWAQGGPLIEQGISKIERFSDALWEATAYTKNAQDIVQNGPNPLVAAMRCYVASKLGDEVEVPDEITNNQTI